MSPTPSVRLQHLLGYLGLETGESIPRLLASLHFDLGLDEINLVESNEQPIDIGHLGSVNSSESTTAFCLVALLDIVCEEEDLLATGRRLDRSRGTSADIEELTNIWGYGTGTAVFCRPDLPSDEGFRRVSEARDASILPGKGPDGRSRPEWVLRREFSYGVDHYRVWSSLAKGATPVSSWREQQDLRTPGGLPVLAYNEPYEQVYEAYPWYLIERV